MRDYVGDLVNKSKVFANMVEEHCDEISWRKAQMALDHLEFAFLSIERRKADRRDETK